MRNDFVCPTIPTILLESPSGALSFRLRRSPFMAVALVCCIIKCAFSFSARAASITWTNTVGGAWSVAANWSPHVVPGTFDDALITTPGTYTVTMDVSPTISSLTLGAASGQQTLTNNSLGLTVNNASVVNANGVLGINSGTVNGLTTLSVNGQLQWNGGSSGAGLALTVQPSAVMNLQGTIVFQGPVTNFGTVNWMSGAVAINTNSGTSGAFWNQPGAVFDIQCSQSLFFGISLPTFHNAGLIRKEIDTGITTFGVFLNNTGTVQAKAGTINFPSGTDLGGIFQADSGAAIAFNGSSYTLSSPPTNFQGPGTVQFTSVNLTLNSFTGGPYTINPTTLLIGQNTVAATGTVTLNGNNLGPGASLTVASNAVMNLQGTIVFQGPVTNFGIVNWVSGGVAINTNSGTFGVFWNQPGAVFDIQCSQSLFYGISLPTFHNAGLIRKEIDTGITTFGVFLNNIGTVQAKAGTINFPTGSDFGGTFQADSGAAIAFNGGNFILSSPPTNFQGPGTVQFTSVNLTLDSFTGGPYTINPTTLLVGQNTVAATGTVTLNGNNLGPGASLTVASNAVMNLQGTIVFQGPVTNFGIVNWVSGGLAINTNSGTFGVFWNQAGAVFDIQCSQNLFYGISVPTFHNAGLIRKEIDAGITTFGVFLNNTGTVQAKAGTINFPSGTDLGGIFQADSGAAIAFNGSSYTLSNPPANFQGPGTVQFTSVNLTLDSFIGGPYTINPSTLLVGQNTIAATSTVTLNGNNLGPGASLTVLSNAVMNLQGTIVFQGPVTNFGTMNWVSGGLAINTNSGTSGVFWNQPGAVFDIQCSQSFFYGISVPTFHNAGLIRKSATSGLTSITIAIDNTGTIQAQTGIIGIQGPYTENAGAILGVSLSGLAPGTGFGQIQFTGAPTFAGKFAVNTLNGYHPNLGDSFAVMTYPSFTGGLSGYNGLNIGGGLLLTPNLAASALTLVTGRAPTSLSGISVSGTNVVLKGADGLTGKTNITLTSTNAAKPLAQWTPIATNVLAADGAFTITLTNAVTPGVPRQFYILQVQ
jgi:hypothetical protein